MSLAGVFVTMSRVRCGKHLRLLQHPGRTHQQNYGYLTKLKPLNSVMAFYHGFEEDTSTQLGDKPNGLVWKPDKVLSYSP